MVLVCIYLVLIGIFLILLRYSMWRNNFAKNFPGKKQKFYNILGDVVEFLLLDDVHQGFMDSLTNTAQLFIKEQLFCVWIGYEPVIVFIRSKANEELLKGVKMIDKSWIYDGICTVLGTGLITSKGEKWKSRRKLLMPCFHQNILRSFLVNFNEGAQRLTSSLQEETKKDFTFISKPIKLCALDIICETIFGVKIKATEKEFAEYTASLKRLEDIVMKGIFTPWLWPSIIYWNTKIGKEHKYRAEAMHQVTKKIIREKKECYLRGETDFHSGKQKALMDLLLQKHFETGELSEEDIREEVDTFMAAGHDTTAITVEWALYLIGLHPDVQAKLHEEIDQIFGGDVDRDVTERDLQDLQYLDCVLKESNRVYPSVPIYVRQAGEDTTICGYFIPKGTACALYTYILHRDEDVFPDPEAFKPERFLPENRKNIPSCAYCPFSAGPRKCIGYKFAEMEVKVIVATILRNFTIQSLDERSKMKTVSKITLQPSSPIRIRFRSRSSKKDS